MNNDMPLSYEEQLRKDCPALFVLQEAMVRGGAAMPYGRETKAATIGIHPDVFFGRRRDPDISDKGGYSADGAGAGSFSSSPKIASMSDKITARHQAKSQADQQAQVARTNMLYQIKASLDRLPAETLKQILMLVQQAN